MNMVQTREEVLKVKREHYYKNIEKYISRCKEWCKKNEDRLKKTQKIYYESHKAKNKKKNRIYKHNYYKRNKTKVDKANKEWRKKNPDKVYSYTKKQRQRNPEKSRARKAAFKKIPIPKGQLCQRCNKKLATERHHKDYSKPLEVELLCTKCHNRGKS